MIRTATFICVAAVALIAPQSTCAASPLFSSAAARSTGKHLSSDRFKRSLLQGETFTSSSGSTATATVTGNGTSTGSGTATATVNGSTVSAAECGASASTSTVSFSIARFISTYQRAIADVCLGGGIAADFKEQIRTGVAEAFASAVSNTQVTCTSQGFAYACGEAEASSRDWAETVGGAFAGGFAQAIATCGSCAPVATSASAYSSTFVDLVAEASTFAQSQACVENGEAISVSAWSSCFAEAIAHLTSTTVSEAFAIGECGNAFADVFVSAVTEGDIVLNTACSSEVTVDGTGDGSGGTGGEGDATGST